MRYLFVNELLNADSISATNESTNYPATNLIDVFLEKRFQSTGVSSLIIFSWTADISADCFFYAFHNITALSAVFKNSGGSTLATVTPSVISDVGIEYFTKLTTVRSVEITITGPDPAYIGGMGTGEYYEMPDPLADFGRPLEDNSFIQASPSGQVLSNYEKPLKAHSWSFRDLLLSIGNEIRAFYITLGKGAPFYADFFEEAPELAEPLYCYFTGPPGDQKNGRRIDYTIDLLEAR